MDLVSSPSAETSTSNRYVRSGSSLAYTSGEGTGAAWCTTYGASSSSLPVPPIEYDQVYACNNPTTRKTPFDDDGTQSFQCVELSERFLWAIYGLAPISGDDVDGDDLVSLYSAAHPTLGVGSPGPSSLPEPGDVMSFNEGGDIDSSAGHTAVVISAPDTNGNFTIMSENWADAAGEETAHVDMTGAHDGYVQLEGSSNWNVAPFLELGSSPVITSISPTSGPVGALVTIEGNNLAGASASFNGVPTAISSDSATQLSTSVPQGATTGSVSVTTPSGTTSGPFTVEAGPGLYGALNRYDGPNGHYETTGPQPSGYALEESLGELLMTSQVGTQALYSCRQGATDEFTSLSSTCEGQTYIGREGYDYSSSPSGLATVALYRCRVTSTNTHFDSNSSKCEGQTYDGFLGYLIGAKSFNRYDGPNGHYETTGPQPSGYALEESLGELLMTSQVGTQALYSCRQGATDEFTSLSSTCEGQTYIGREGYDYSSSPSGLATVALYRCRVTSTNTHFDSNSSKCEGQTYDGFLGYLIGAKSFNRYDGTNGHYETTGPQPSGYAFEESLGELLMTSQVGTQALYSCRQGATDEFTSLSSTCEGQTYIGREGYDYSSSPSGLATVALYRCRVTSTNTHFDSNSSKCEGQTYDGFLGHLIAND